jgi:basic membrane protein A and related proteins
MRARDLWKSVGLCFLLGCSSSSSEPAPGPTATPDAGDAATTVNKICMVADIGGLNDRSYNQTAFDGVKQAKTLYGWEIEVAEAKSEADYTPDTDRLAQTGKCALIVEVGPLLFDVTKAAAAKYPSQKFQIFDAVLPEAPNVWGQGYAIDEPSFLAGYVAAAVSKTGVVGTFGGVKIQGVIDFMDGFALGVEYYNTKNAKNVQVIGWDVASQTGTFAGTFIDKTKGRQIGEDFLNQKVDIIFPVAGGVGLGAGDAMLARGGTNMWLIGVDSDWTQSAPAAYTDLILTSVLKKLDRSVVSAVKALVEGTFKGGEYRANLASGQIDLNGFGKYDSMVPVQVKTDLEQIRADIIAGKIKTHK